MEDIQKEGVDPKEKQQDEEALKLVPDEDIRSQTIEKYGLSEDDNSELIDKLVEGEKEGQKKLSTAIRQKVDWRTKAQTPKEEEKEVKPQEPAPKTQPVSSEDIDKMVGEKFEERDLASMDLSDELKSEVKAYAKAKGISYREAAKSPYFDFIKGKEDERIQADEASNSSSGKTIRAKRDFGNLSADDVANFSDEELAEYDKWLRTQE